MLDYEKFEKLRNMILNNSIAQEIVYNQMKDGEKYKDGTFLIIKI